MTGIPFFRQLRSAAVLCLVGVTLSGCGEGDPTGASPNSISQLFGNQLYRSDGVPVGSEALEGKTLIGIFFANPGCPACGAFTPLLVDAYQELKESGRSFEVVLVSLGLSDAMLQQYMAEMEMPWLAESPGSKQANALVQRYNVRWVPTLVIVDKDARTVSMFGRDEVAEYGAAAYDDWMATAPGS